MTISYHWLQEYLPTAIDPEKLSGILTSIGLEVESLQRYEEITGNLQGLVTGEVLESEPHPNADKLKVTRVDTGDGQTRSIVCGASNVAPGQKVVVALPGTTIHPVEGAPFTMKAAKIRGVESQGMLCAEDEIGLGQSHAGIIILPQETPVGIPVADVFQPYSDWMYEIGLTPNHMDAMSHLGVARDVCAWLTHHEGRPFSVKTPYPKTFSPDSEDAPIEVIIENPRACGRYSGISLGGLSIGPSPLWMQRRLRAIGLRPINNIVDITNYVLHETGQPLHAFDAQRIEGGRIVVGNLPSGTLFTTLDGKERTLSAEDLMICDARKGLALGGVFGGMNSGVTEKTTGVFLESAWFEPIGIRKTSLRHGLRTDAALRFEKGVDISGTVSVLERAALLIRELAGGKITSAVVDVYPTPPKPRVVTLTYDYLWGLSGKKYEPAAVKNILQALGFNIKEETKTGLTVIAPNYKTDIALPADLVEEVMRIDGLDNIEIPARIRLTPAVETDRTAMTLKEKAAGYLVGLGFHEIMTNSISNSAFFGSYPEEGKVRLLNSLSSELDMLRPSMVETGLEAIAYNLNRKITALKFFEFGKTYAHDQGGKGLTPYLETDHLCLYLTGPLGEDTWHIKTTPVDYYYTKGVVEALMRLCGVDAGLAKVEQVDRDNCARFDIRQPVFFVDIDWGALRGQYKPTIQYAEVPRFPAVQRDLALVVDESLPYARIEAVAYRKKLRRLKTVQLFDVFRSDKIGEGKKSVALSFTFQDEEKTMTDKEIDSMMTQLMEAFESELGAGLRK